MKKIGCFRQEGNGWIGTIAVLQFETKARVAPNLRKTSSEMPDFVVTKEVGAGGFEIELGAAWKRISPELRMPFIEVVIDDPALSQPIHGVLWKTPDEDAWFLYWDRHTKGEGMIRKLPVDHDAEPEPGLLPPRGFTSFIQRFYPELVPG